MYSLAIHLFSVLAIAASNAAIENPAFNDLLTAGVKMSNGDAIKLPPPIMPDGLDPAGQQAAVEKAAEGRYTFDELIKPGYYTPVIVKVRTPKRSESEGPAGRSVDVWFIARGNWKTLTSAEFLDSMTKKPDEGKSRVVLQAGILDPDELKSRKLQVSKTESLDERFIYTTFSLFERVEISATRFSVISRGQDSIVVAGKIDSRFDGDKKYPNQWRALLRNELAEITPGPANGYAAAGGYAKITRMKAPADCALVECHIVYEEPFAWFDGANLVKQKLPAMVQEKVRTFRRKLLAAGETAK